MNSTLKRDNIKEILTSLDKSEKEKLIRLALAYRKSSFDDDEELFRANYNALLSKIRLYEENFGTTLIETPDGSCIVALNTFAGIIAKAAKEIEKASRPQKGVLTFCSIEEANQWFSRCPNVVPTSISAQTQNRLGLFANHPVFTSVTIEYMDLKKPSGFHYGIMSDSTTSLFLNENTERYKAKWHEKNPGYEIVMMTQSSCARGSTASIAFGFGFDRVQHVNHLIIYRTPDHGMGRGV